MSVRLFSFLCHSFVYYVSFYSELKMNNNIQISTHSHNLVYDHVTRKVVTDEDGNVVLSCITDGSIVAVPAAVASQLFQVEFAQEADDPTQHENRHLLRMTQL